MIFCLHFSLRKRKEKKNRIKLRKYAFEMHSPKLHMPPQKKKKHTKKYVCPLSVDSSGGSSDGDNRSKYGSSFFRDFFFLCSKRRVELTRILWTVLRIEAWSECVGMHNYSKSFANNNSLQRIEWVFVRLTQTQYDSLLAWNRWWWRWWWRIQTKKWKTKKKMESIMENTAFGYYFTFTMFRL